MVVGVKAADSIMHMYSTFYSDLNRSLNLARRSEEFAYRVVRLHGFEWKPVAMHQLPFLKAMHIESESDQPVLCFRSIHPNPALECFGSHRIRHPFCDQLFVQ